MKNILFLPVLFVILNGCSNDSNRLAKMEAQINQLESKLNDSYKPGFGEFMGNVQIHHAKLWFAGIHNNWELSDVEINEIDTEHLLLQLEPKLAWEKIEKFYEKIKAI